MFIWLEKWALKRLLIRLTKQKFKDISLVNKIWKNNHDEIEIKIAEAIKKVIVTIIQREIARNN